MYLAMKQDSGSYKLSVELQRNVPYLISFSNKWLIKCFAFPEISANASSSNSQRMAVTLVRVSASLSPWNGDTPLSLQRDRVHSQSSDTLRCLQPLTYFSLQPTLSVENVTGQKSTVFSCSFRDTAQKQGVQWVYIVFCTKICALRH